MPSARTPFLSIVSRIGLPILLIALVIGLSRGASAQASKGVLSGVVLTSDGVPVASAQVFYQSAEGTSPHVLRTDAHGRFHSSPLRAGFYEVRAEAGGKWSEWSHNVIVPAGGEENLTLRLARGSAPKS